MNGSQRLEELLAALLRIGSWLASAAVATGFALALIDARFGTRSLGSLPNLRIATIGIAIFILLPSLRVLLMLFLLIRESDYRLAATAGLVLAIILLGIVLGLRATPQVAGRAQHLNTGKRGMDTNFAKRTPAFWEFTCLPFDAYIASTAHSHRRSEVRL